MPPPTHPAPIPQTPATKKRRLEASSASLRKPFRSPLLTRNPADGTSLPTPPTTTPLRTPQNRTYPTTTPSKLSSYHPSPASPSSTYERTSTPEAGTPDTAAARITFAPPRSGPLFKASPLHNADPELRVAQKQHTALTLELHAVQAAITTTKQALALEKSAEDTILEGEIWKWKHATRSAVEALYATATEKVNMRRGEWRGLFGRKKRWEDDDAEELRRQRAIEGADGADEDEGVGGEEEMQKRKEEVEREDEAWGLSVMLRCLGIPESMVGWDAKACCWEDIG